MTNNTCCCFLSYNYAGYVSVYLDFACLTSVAETTTWYAAAQIFREFGSKQPYCAKAMRKNI